MSLNTQYALQGRFFLRLSRPRRSTSHIYRAGRKKCDIRVGDLYTDCSYQALRCVYVNPMKDEVMGQDLVSGQERSCSIYHCSPEKLTRERAKELAEAFEKDGERGLMRLNGWTEEAIDEFMKTWRKEPGK